jgi:transketolase
LCLWPTGAQFLDEAGELVEPGGHAIGDVQPPEPIDHLGSAGRGPQGAVVAADALDDLLGAGPPEALGNSLREARRQGSLDGRYGHVDLRHRVPARTYLSQGDPPMGATRTIGHGSDFRGELGQQLRVDSVRASAAAGSGHPTSSMSAADLIAVLLDGHLRLDLANPDDPRNDHLIFSKGHASPLYYSMLKAAEVIDDAELLTFRKLHSRLEGHPTPAIPVTDVATGSLGQGLPIGVGVALTGQRLDRLDYRVWVLCGDSEMAEGSMWEAFQYAAWQRLDNIVAIIDVNRLGQTRETMLGWDLDGYVARLTAFGWHAIEIDGHDVDAIEAAYSEAEATRGRPTAIVARTLKGKGVKAVEDRPGMHGKPLDHPEEAIAELGGERKLTVNVAKPQGGQPHTFAVRGGELPRWELGDSEATRKAYGLALTALGDMRGDVVALDGEVSNSTYSEEFESAHPDRFFEMFIAEQQMVAAAVGIQVHGRWVPFASTFAAFLARAYDFIRMAAISRANIRLSGSHAGVSIGEDGPSQMALEDIAAMRAIHGTTVLHPSDANQAAKLVAEMADRPGICYIRTLRGKTPIRTPADEDVRIGGSRIAAGADADDVAIVACGVTVDEAVKAAEALEGEGIAARVIDAYSIKPLDAETIRAAARECEAIVTVEDHAPEGGLGDAVLEALASSGDQPPAVVKLAVRDLPGSGTPAELVHGAGIAADSIITAARELARAGTAG